ncbi:MAG: exodeoxyribonuclease VII large subunit [Chlorobi bacterium]|nr:exodeoxyribonuclease VII large subunit [Chlorobiota bacterium]
MQEALDQVNLYSVSQITREIKAILESSFTDVYVTGEISNFRRHSSGHLYFTLKDKDAQISAVMFKGNAYSLFFSPTDGMEVLCRGDISVYEPRGNYQLLVREMAPRGAGALQLAFEKLKRKLYEEGLFDENRKQPLPKYPERIGIVTSPTGAAVRDMISVIQRRFPVARLVLAPVSVQGAQAASEIADAIRRFNEKGDVDVLIIGRGGGSLEDLWAFNEEVVARAIAESTIPVISAVGHEVDYTIADFVADVRAATPSMAGEIVVPEQRELLETLSNFSYTLTALMDSKLKDRRQAVTALLRHRALLRAGDIVLTGMQRVDELTRKIEIACNHRISMKDMRLRELQAVIRQHNPELLLRKGYTITRKDGRVLTTIEGVSPEDILNVEFIDGKAHAVVESTVKK